MGSKTLEETKTSLNERTVQYSILGREVFNIGGLGPTSLWLIPNPVSSIMQILPRKIHPWHKKEGGGGGVAECHAHVLLPDIINRFVLAEKKIIIGL